ncbi:ribonuclease DdI-like isoform X2 [Varroa destructor]|uniref:Uncharacterized protein n=1 Tax=Varroa destructor TaxID=109461 RepID=A0A7M7KR06_VARDE|nr:ribonuclease DdI-like isoform X2 [Varroa destructor]
MRLAMIAALVGTLLVTEAYGWNSISYAGVLHDNFWLSLHNRAAVCHSPETNCHKLENPRQAILWTVRGLWPMRGHRNFTFTSPNDTFHIDEIKCIRDDLNRFWPSHNSSNEVLWADEFMEYGTYAIYQGTKVTNALEYFNVTLQLYKHFDISKWLTTGHISPSNKKPISRRDIQNAVSLRYSSSFYLYCQGQKNGIDILWEIRLCFDSNLQPASNCIPPEMTCHTWGVWYLEDSLISKGKERFFWMERGNTPHRNE